MDTILYARAVTIVAGPARLEGMLAIPPDPIGLVLFAHGSGSGRLSPRNLFVARHLHEARMATLLMDLLQEWEAEDRRNVFDIRLLADRLLGATAWLATQPTTCKLRLGYFGASTGGGAALQAAAMEPQSVSAVVSRGGRPDLADQYLSSVRAPTLLIVGGDDQAVLDLNRSALLHLGCEKRLAVVPGASHLFEEPGTLDQVAALAREWFHAHLAAPTGSR